MNGYERVKACGEQVDELAVAFLSQEPTDLYGMLRYFMGYADETFATIPGHKGKRLRPALLLCIAEAYGVTKKALPAALSIELFHNFTLIHDDIEDNDELRRGRPTVWKLWGVNKALNAGDAQVLLALEALGQMQDAATHATLSRFLLARYREVVEGQHADFALAEATLEDALVSEENYLRMIEQKSAVLIGASAAASAYIAHRPQDERDALYQFGKEFGIAYQLHDDHQSLWGTSAETGKAVGGDMRERKKTLPVIHAREHLPPHERALLAALYANPAAEMSEALALIERSGAQEPLRARIRVHKERAADALRTTTVSPSVQQDLLAFVDTLIPEVRT